MVLKSIEHRDFSANRRKFDVVDFGCADGTMLEAIAVQMAERFGSGLGLDVFRSGIPSANIELNINFKAIDLFKQFPYPIEESSRDIAIASAFLKHHPSPVKFLVEVDRILRPGGLLLLLDPRPFVVRIGQRFGRFNPSYNPSLWSKVSIELMLNTSKLDSNLRVVEYWRYWVAPTYFLYRAGLERVMPKFLKNTLSLHQCLVLQK